MERDNDLKAMIHQLEVPAFFVKKGTVTAVNPSAAARTVSVDQTVEELFVSDYQEYLDFTNGNLFVSLALSGTVYGCCIQRLQKCDLFVLEEEPSVSELKALALAAEHLRMPLSEMMLTLQRMPEEQTMQRRLLNHNLMKLQRVVGNMSDAAMYLNADPRMAKHNVCAIVQEIAEKSAHFLSQAGITLKLEIPDKPIYCMLERTLLSRAVYNMISNGVKFSPSGEEICLSLIQRGQKLYISVENKEESESKQSLGNFFTQYKRQPAIEDPRCGLGLGMTLIRAAAKAHNGTVLVEQSDKTKVTMSLLAVKDTACEVHTPILLPDVYGGMDQALIELSDILPCELY